MYKKRIKINIKRSKTMHMFYEHAALLNFMIFPIISSLFIFFLFDQGWASSQPVKLFKAGNITNITNRYRVTNIDIPGKTSGYLNPDSQFSGNFYNTKYQSNQRLYSPSNNFTFSYQSGYGSGNPFGQPYYTGFPGINRYTAMPYRNPFSFRGAGPYERGLFSPYISPLLYGGLRSYGLGGLGLYNLGGLPIYMEAPVGHFMPPVIPPFPFLINPEFPIPGIYLPPPSDPSTTLSISPSPPSYSPLSFTVENYPDDPNSDDHDKEESDTTNNPWHGIDQNLYQTSYASLLFAHPLNFFQGPSSYQYPFSQSLEQYPYPFSLFNPPVILPDYSSRRYVVGIIDLNSDITEYLIIMDNGEGLPGDLEVINNRVRKYVKLEEYNWIFNLGGKTCDICLYREYLGHRLVWAWSEKWW